MALARGAIVCSCHPVLNHSQVRTCWTTMTAPQNGVNVWMCTRMSSKREERSVPVVSLIEVAVSGARGTLRDVAGDTVYPATYRPERARRRTRENLAREKSRHSKYTLCRQISSCSALAPPNAPPTRRHALLTPPPPLPHLRGSQPTRRTVRPAVGGMSAAGKGGSQEGAQRGGARGAPSPQVVRMAVAWGVRRRVPPLPRGSTGRPRQSHCRWSSHQRCVPPPPALPRAPPPSRARHGYRLPRRAPPEQSTSEPTSRVRLEGVTKPGYPGRAVVHPSSLPPCLSGSVLQRIACNSMNRVKNLARKSSQLPTVCESSLVVRWKLLQFPKFCLITTATRVNF